MKDRWTDDEPPFFAKCHKEPPAGDDFTPEEKRAIAIWVALLALEEKRAIAIWVALLALAFLALTWCLGPIDAPSPNTVGLEDLR